MKHRITIRSFRGVRDELGQTIQEWYDFKTVWCAIKTVKGTEYFSTGVVRAENTYRFIIRYMPGIKASMQIMFEGRLFKIESVLNDDEERRTITIVAKETI